jgi:D-alanyl-D-alanine carboxypeptidase
MTEGWKVYAEHEDSTMSYMGTPDSVELLGDRLIVKIARTVTQKNMPTIVGVVVRTKNSAYATRLPYAEKLSKNSVYHLQVSLSV